MISIALTQRIMPVRRSIMTKKDYEKFRLSWFYLNVPQKFVKLGLVYGSSIHFEPRYITRPLVDHEIMAMKLISSQTQKNKGTGFYQSLVDAIVFQTIDSQYLEFLNSWAAHQTLVNQHVGEHYFDYDEFEADIIKTKEMISRKESLKDINKQLSRSKKKMQIEINRYNLEVRKSHNNLCKYFQETFNIREIFLF